jgi:hypothetical protein
MRKTKRSKETRKKRRRKRRASSNHPNQENLQHKFRQEHTDWDHRNSYQTRKRSYR